MGGILGILYFDGRPADARELVAMARASSRRSVDGYGTWMDASSTIGHQHSRVTPESLTERQPLLSSGVVISFDGRLDNREELLRTCALLPPDERGTVSDPALVLAAYRELGEPCAARLAGDFAFALFDTARQRLLLARDLMAARPLFYAALPGGVVFASEMKALLAHRDIAARPDEDALADLVLNGYFDGARTWLDGVRSVPPGAVVTITPRGVTVSNVTAIPDDEIRYGSAAEYTEQFLALFEQAVRRRLRSAHPVAVAASGGVDSSSIYCTAARVAGAAALRAFTLAFPRGSGADEHEYVDALRACALHVDAIDIDAVRLVTDVEGSVGRTEMPRLPWDCQDALLARARDAGCRVLLDGFCGDQVLAGPAYWIDLTRAGRFATVAGHLREYAAWMDASDPRTFAWQLAGAAARAAAPLWLMTAAKRTIGRVRARRRYPPWFTEAFRERAHQRALDRARRRRRFSSAHQEQIWTSATSGHYLAAVLQTGNAGIAYDIDTAYPFRDRDLIAFLAAIPGDVICDRGIPKALLRNAMRGIVPEAIRLRRTKADGTFLSNRAAQMIHDDASRWLRRDAVTAAAGFLDARVFRSHMEPVFRQRLAHDDHAHLGWQVADTLALELWATRFCGNHAARA